VDGTLYPTDHPLTDAIDRRLNEYLDIKLGIPPERQDAARIEMTREHGSMFRGLMVGCGVDPAEYFEFLCCEVTDPRAFLEPDPVLRKVLAEMPGKRYLLSNAPTVHCERVAEGLGVLDVIDGVFDIAWADWIGKPAESTYLKVLGELGASPSEVTAIDDMLAGLDTARALGLRTVHVGGPETEPTQDGHVRVRSIHELPARAPWLY